MNVAHGDLIRRKLSPRRQAADPRASALEDALRVVLPRVADDLLGLPLEVTATVVEAPVEKASVLGELSETDAIFLMTREGGAPALCIVDLPLRAGLIEVQTVGRISPAAPAERAATRTDAVVLSDILDGWIAATDGAPLGVAGFSRAAWPIDARAAGLTLDPGRFEATRITLSLQDGVRTGVLSFFLPLSDRGAGRAGAVQADLLRAQIAEVPAVMTAVLTRLRRPLGQVLGFRTGDVIDLGGDALSGVHLEAAGRRRIVPARLGRLGEMRAVRFGRTDADMTTGSAKPGRNQAATGKSARAGAALPAPDADAAPALPDDLPALPDLPDLPDMPDLPDASGLPELPDLPPLDGAGPVLETVIAARPGVTPFRSPTVCS